MRVGARAGGRAARNMQLPGWAVICLVAVSALAAGLFDHFGRFGLALPTMFGAAMIGIASGSPLSCLFRLGWSICS